MLRVIDNYCKIARSLDRSSTDLFGGLPVVIFIGDFFQFPPVWGLALWKEPRNGSGEDENGRILWHQFKEVIILDEQMRQSEDAPFHDLLSRARTGTLTEADRSFLNRAIRTDPIPECLYISCASYPDQVHRPNQPPASCRRLAPATGPRY